MALPTASDNPFPSLLITEGTEPAAPAAGKQRLYIDSTSHKLKRTDSSGTDVTIEGAASGAVTASGLTMATARILGRTTAATGAVEEITVGSGLTLSAGSLTATGGGTGTVTTVKDEGTNLSTAVTSIDFVGSGVTATGTTAVTVTIPGSSGGIIGAKTYSTGSDTAWASTSSTTVADIDATNAAITVTIPASGAIVVAVDLDWTYTVANSGGFLVLRTGSTDLQALGTISGAVGSGNIGGGSVSSGHFSGHFYATGLTPGSLTLKVGFRRLGSTTLNVYANDGSGAAGHLAGPFNMVVWAA